MKPPKRLPPGQGARTRGCWRVAGALAATLILSACASTVADLSDPAPEGAPQAASAYPAVHDLPPTRAERALTDDEQVRLQKELTEAGHKQPAKVEEIERADGRPAPSRAPRQPSRQAAGTRPNP